MIYDNYDNPKLPRNTDPAAVDIRNFSPNHIKVQLLLQRGRRKLEMVILSNSKAGMCVIVLRFCQNIKTRRTENGKDVLDFVYSSNLQY
jgi:hypothetical protein